LARLRSIMAVFARAYRAGYLRAESSEAVGWIAQPPALSADLPVFRQAKQPIMTTTFPHAFEVVEPVFAPGDSKLAEQEVRWLPKD